MQTYDEVMVVSFGDGVGQEEQAAKQEERVQ